LDIENVKNVSNATRSHKSGSNNTENQKKTPAQVKNQQNFARAMKTVPLRREKKKHSLKNHERKNKNKKIFKSTQERPGGMNTKRHKRKLCVGDRTKKTDQSATRENKTHNKSDRQAIFRGHVAFTIQNVLVCLTRFVPASKRETTQRHDFFTKISPCFARDFSTYLYRQNRTTYTFRLVFLHNRTTTRKKHQQNKRLKNLTI
jgi:hypothetical protein